MAILAANVNSMTVTPMSLLGLILCVIAAVILARYYRGTPGGDTVKDATAGSDQRDSIDGVDTLAEVYDQTTDDAENQLAQHHRINPATGLIILPGSEYDIGGNYDMTSRKYSSIEIDQL